MTWDSRIGAEVGKVVRSQNAQRRQALQHPQPGGWRGRPVRAASGSPRSWCARTGTTSLAAGGNLTFTCDVSGNAATPLLVTATFTIAASEAGTTELSGVFRADSTDLDDFDIFTDAATWANGEVRTFSVTCTFAPDDDARFRLYNGVTGIDVVVSCTLVAVQMLDHQGAVCCVESGGGGG